MFADRVSRRAVVASLVVAVAVVSSVLYILDCYVNSLVLSVNEVMIFFSGSLDG